MRPKADPVYWLPIPREEETFHTTILGDTGMGKSQIIHQFLRQIAHRAREGPGETAIVYDPKGEFLESHFDAARGDLVLNPLDKRFPFWGPASEIVNLRQAGVTSALGSDPSAWALCVRVHNTVNTFFSSFRGNSRIFCSRCCGP